MHIQLFPAASRTAVLALALSSTGGLLHAQIPRDTWVASAFDNFIAGTGGGGLFLVSADRTTPLTITNPTPNMAGANAVYADGVGILYYGTISTSRVSIPNPGEVFRAILSVSGSTASVVETRLTTLPVPGSVNGLTIRSDELWYVSENEIGTVSLGGGAPTPVLQRSGTSINGLFQSITTNGREIFFGTSTSSASPDPATVWAFDATDPNPTARGVADLSGSSFDMNMGRDGNLVVGVFGGRVVEVDPRLPHDPNNGIVNIGTPLNPIQTAPQGNANGTSFNPWTEIAGVVAGFGSSPRQFDHLDAVTGTFFPNPVGNLGTGVPSNVTSATELPFELLGAGCAGSTGTEPRFDWRGLPAGGQGFDLELYDADDGAGVLVVGTSITNSGLGPLPFDLSSVLRAASPGCNLLVSPDILVPLVVPPTGTLTFNVSLPALPSLDRTEAFAQWLVFSSAGPISVSEGIRVRIRS